jgi:competence protein ComGC
MKIKKMLAEERGEVPITMIAIFLAAVLMFIFPLVSISEQQDKIAQEALQAATSNFVNSVAQKGYISKEDYDKYCSEIGATGNTYDIQIEVQKIDENPGKKTTITSGDLIGENVSYSEFTDTILEKVNGSSEKYVLNQGDNVIVTAKSKNIRASQLSRSVGFLLKGNSGDVLEASAASLVANSGNSK